MSGVTPEVDSLVTLVYFAAAGLITLGVETLRRWVKRRMDIWEAEHPIPDEHMRSPRKQENDEN